MIDLNDEALALAAKELGTTKKDTVNAALDFCSAAEPGLPRYPVLCVEVRRHPVFARDGVGGDDGSVEPSVLRVR